MSAGQFRALQAKPKRHKFAATRTEGPDGMGGTRTYDSAKGAKLAFELELQRKAGCIIAFLPEVSVIVGDLAGKAVRHRVDALVIHALGDDGTWTGEFVEAKGFDAPVGKRKRLALERATGTKVRVL